MLVELAIHFAARQGHGGLLGVGESPS